MFHHILNRYYRECTVLIIAKVASIVFPNNAVLSSQEFARGLKSNYIINGILNPLKVVYGRRESANRLYFNRQDVNPPRLLSHFIPKYFISPVFAISKHLATTHPRQVSLPHHQICRICYAPFTLPQSGQFIHYISKSAANNVIAS